MEKWTLFLVLAILSNAALGLNLRNKRQAQTSTDADVTDCIRNCPVTPEYNPVCGSNNETFDNPGRLACAQACGVTVTLLRHSRCS